MYKPLNATGRYASENTSMGLEGGPGNPNGAYNNGPRRMRPGEGRIPAQHPIRGVPLHTADSAYSTSTTSAPMASSVPSTASAPVAASPVPTVQSAVGAPAVTGAPTPGTSAGYVPQQFNLASPSSATHTSDAIATMDAAQKYALDPNSAFMKNARQEGLEFSASRGLLNSSIAAGNSQRAAIQASQPIAQAIFNDSNNSRDFYRAAKLLPLQASLTMATNFADLAAQQPDIYTPGYINGMTNFFVSNMQNVMANFFGDSTFGGA